MESAFDRDSAMCCIDRLKPQPKRHKTGYALDERDALVSVSNSTLAGA